MKVTQNDLAQLLPKYLVEVEGRNVAGNFRCVLPNHNDANPSMSLTSSGKRVKCFVCQNTAHPNYSTWSIFDILRAKTGVTNFNDLMHIAAYFTMGATLSPHLTSAVEAMEFKSDTAKPTTTKKTVRRKQTDTPAKLEKRKKYIKKCQKRPCYHPYLISRGISEETYDKIGAGYDPSFAIYDSTVGYKLKYPTIIFPMSNDSYCARLLANVDSHLKTRCEGAKGVINEQALHSSDPIFIVEGPFDLMSLVEVGASAVSTASVNAHALLVEAIAKINPRGTYIISFDYDPSADTQNIIVQNASNLAQQLTALGATVYIDQVSQYYKDANDYLVADRTGFTTRVQQMTEQYR
ncbi:MAG: toprim domain-containing protein [Coriobacteriia bacterium]|nr:toprim domain-containing protein [Coriobacteriia bacterium]